MKKIEKCINRTILGNFVNAKLSNSNYLKLLSKFSSCNEIINGDDNDLSNSELIARLKSKFDKSIDLLCPDYKC